MAPTYASIVLLLAAFMVVECAMANKEWNTSVTAGNWNHTNNLWGFWHTNPTHGSNRVVVGGPQNWRFGFNYTDWVIKNGPFFLNDTLVFRYDPPNGTTFPHSVYMLPNFKSFQNCDMRKAKRIGTVKAGAGQGFEFVLKRWKPYFFACGEGNGFHCNAGMMKFAVWPLIRWNY